MGVSGALSQEVKRIELHCRGVYAAFPFHATYK